MLIGSEINASHRRDSGSGRLLQLAVQIVQASRVL